MNVADLVRTFAGRPLAVESEADPSAAIYATKPALVLPLVTRSASLLALLLQDDAVDLELASAVIGLDPGLSFGTLQLANRDRAETNDPIWQLPLAVVAAGREPLEQLLQHAPRIESGSDAGRRTRLGQLVSNAVTRACVAHLLARDLGSCAPRKSYLSGLLFDLPAIGRLAVPPITQAVLLAAMCHTLPAAMVRTAMVSLADDNESLPSDPLVAIGRIADAVLQAAAATSPVTTAMEDLAASPLWCFWKEIGTQERIFLLGQCASLAGWAKTNLHSMDPWEFMAALERRNSWE